MIACQSNPELTHCRGLTLIRQEVAIRGDAPDSGPLTLDTAIQTALKGNVEIRVLTAEIAAARGEVTTARARLNPEISVGPGIKRVGNPVGGQFHGDFGLEQTIEWPGKRELRSAVAEKSVAINQLALAGFRWQLAIQVRRVYFTMLASREAVTLREERLALAKTFVDAAIKKVEGGFAPDFEATKAEVEVVTAQKALRDAQAQQDVARVALNALMGRTPSASLTIAGNPDHYATLPDEAALLRKALAQNPAIKVKVAEAQKAGISVESIRKSQLPDFKIGPSIEYTRDEQTIGFGVSLPLPLWDHKEGEIATAAAEQEKARAEIEVLRREITRDVTAAAVNLTAAKESLAFNTPELHDKLKAALDAAEKNYSEGGMPLLLYLEAQRTYFDMQADYYDTLKKLYEAQAELESAVGVPLN